MFSLVSRKFLAMRKIALYSVYGILVNSPIYQQFECGFVFQKGSNFHLYDTPTDKIFWKPLTRSELTQDDPNSLVDSVKKSIIEGKDDTCCFIMAESLTSYILTKKSAISEVVNKLNPNMSIFSTLSQELKKVASLYLMNDKSYGQIVNAREIPINAKTPELYRMLENHQLWQNRYISSKVRTLKGPF